MATTSMSVILAQQDPLFMIRSNSNNSSKKMGRQIRKIRLRRVVERENLENYKNQLKMLM